MSNVFSALIAFIPIFSIYASPIAGLTIGDFLCAFLLIFAVLKGKTKLYVLKRHGFSLIFVLYVVVIGIFSVLVYPETRFDVVTRSVRFSFYIVATAIISSNDLFSYNVASKWCIWISAAGSVFALFQFIMYRCFGIAVNGFASFLPVYHTEYTQIDYASKYAVLFRPTSFFLEPAAFSQYAIVGLALALFSGRKRVNNLFFSILISIGILLSRSSQGVVLMVVLWIFFYIQMLKNNRKLLLILPLLVLLILAMISVPSLNWTLKRLLNSGNKAGAVYQRMGAISVIKDIPMIQLIFGCGLGTVPDSAGLSSLVYIIWGTGLIGIILMMVFMLRNLFDMLKESISRFLIGFIFLITFSYSMIPHSYIYVFYIYFFLAFAPTSNDKAKQNNHRNRIMFLFGKYKPDCSANGICADRVVMACKNHGYDVSCIVNEQHGTGQYSNINGIEVYRIKAKFSQRLEELSRRLKPRLLMQVIKYIAICIVRIKTIIFLPVWPLTSPLYSFRFLCKAQQVYDENPYSLLVSIHTPFDAVLAGYFMKILNPSIKFVPYFLDALAGGIGPRGIKESFVNKRTIWYERQIVRKADKAIVMLSAKFFHEKAYHNESFYSKFDFLDIPLLDLKNKQPDYQKRNGFRSFAKDGNIQFVYVGSILVPQRNPVPIMEVFLRLFKKNKNMKALFVGDCNAPNVFKNYSDRTNGRIEYVPRVSGEEAGRFQVEADILVNLGNANENLVPSKVFEYMCSLKPIVTTFSSVQDTSMKYFSRYPKVFCIDERDNQYDCTASNLEEFVYSSVGKNINPDFLSEFSLNTPEAFVDSIDAICEELE